MKAIIHILRILLSLFFIALLIATNVAARKKANRETITWFGHSIYIAQTDHMQPSIAKGDLIMAKAQNTYKALDVALVERMGVSEITRIVAIYKGGYITRKDGVQKEDEELLYPDQIIGCVYFAQSGIDKVIQFSYTIPGITAIAIIWAGILLLPRLAFFAEE